MNSHVWRQQRLTAWLSWRGLSAQVDAARPELGLHQVRLAAGDFSPLQLLGVRLAAAAAPEAYLRGHDLVAIYPETAEHPFRTLVYWRVVPAADPQIAAIDVQVSVQTSLLESAPAVETLTELPPGELLHLADPQAAQGARSISAARELSPADGAACCLFRPPGCGVSYVELVHPAEFHRLAIVPQTGGGWRLAARMFPGSLEKGVILRGRLRAAIVPRAHDVQAAAELYDSHRRADPPLTT